MSCLTANQILSGGARQRIASPSQKQKRRPARRSGGASPTASSHGGGLGNGGLPRLTPSPGGSRSGNKSRAKSRSSTGGSPAQQQRQQARSQGRRSPAGGTGAQSADAAAHLENTAVAEDPGDEKDTVEAAEAAALPPAAACGELVGLEGGGWEALGMMAAASAGGGGGGGGHRLPGLNMGTVHDWQYPVDEEPLPSLHRGSRRPGTRGRVGGSRPGTRERSGGGSRPGTRESGRPGSRASQAGSHKSGGSGSVQVAEADSFRLHIPSFRMLW